MTPEQIENFREVLFFSLGIYATTMSDEEIISIRDKMQADILVESEAKDED